MFKLTKRFVLMFCRQLKNITFEFQKIFTFANILGRGTNISCIFKLLVQDYSMHTTPFLLGGGGRGGDLRISMFRVGLLEKRGGTGDFENIFLCHN